MGFMYSMYTGAKSMWESLLGMKTVVRMGTLHVNCCFCVSSSNDGFKMVFLSSR